MNRGSGYGLWLLNKKNGPEKRMEWFIKRFEMSFGWESINKLSGGQLSRGNYSRRQLSGEKLS